MKGANIKLRQIKLTLPFLAEPSLMKATKHLWLLCDKTEC